MKVLKFTITTLLLSLFISFRSSAAYMPPALPSSGADSAVSTMTQLMLKEAINSLGIDMPENDYKNAWRIMTGQTYDTSFDFTYLPAENIPLGEGISLFDSSGNIVDLSDCTVAWGHNGHGMYTSFIYDNATGNICNIGSSFALSESTLNANLSSDYWGDVRTIAAPMTTNAQPAIYKPADLSPELKTYVESQPFSLYAISRDHSFCVVVPNACSPDCTVMYANNTYTMNYSGVDARQMPTILANDDSFVYWLGSSNLQGFSTGSYYYYNHSFTKRSWIHNAQNPLWNGGTLYYHIPTEQEFNSVVNGIGSEMEQKVIFANGIEPFSVPDTMNYDKLRNQQITKNITINNDYDYSQPMTVNNYPVTVTYPTPDVAPEYNTYETIYNYYTSPNDSTSIGTINPSDLTDNIPILSNLKNRFPFSIPWDIKALFTGVNVQREAPSFHWEIYLPIVDYTWSIDVDFSVWNTQAGIFRTCFLVLFIIALAMFAYRHYFGS